LANPSRPLAGKRIVVTRAPEQSPTLVSALGAEGAHVVVFPLVAFAPPDDWRLLDEQLQKLKAFDAILFLSRNAVRYVFQRCRETAVPCEFAPSSRPFVAAVGEATKEAARREGLVVDYVAKGHTAESLGRELRSSFAGRTVLLPRGNRGDDELPRALREAGAKVTEVVAYRTIPPPNVDPAVLEDIRSGAAECVVFASPSAFHNLCELVPPAEVAVISQRLAFAAIGPTTACAIRDLGARVAVEAAEPSAEGIAEALVAHFAAQAAKTRTS
jgi:uroporphyrinogen-III synthase